MSDKFNNSELFMELSTEEQQLIAGGQFFAAGLPTSVGTSFSRSYGIQSGGLGTLSGLGGYGSFGMYGGGLGGFGRFGGAFGRQYSINSGGFLF